MEGETGQELVVTENGSYQVEYTSPDGCTALSEAVEIFFNEEPPVAPFVNENNLLQLSDPGQISDLYSLQWLLNDAIIIDGTEATYCISQDGLYSLVVTDIITGCKSVFSAQEIYNPGYPNCVNATEDLSMAGLRLFPNPFKSAFSIEATLLEAGNIDLKISNAIGQEIFQKDFGMVSGDFNYQLDMSDQANGIYFLSLRLNDQQIIAKLIKSN